MLNVNLTKYYSKIIIVKQKNKSLKEKLSKTHKRHSIDFDTIRASFFKRRSFHMSSKNPPIDDSTTRKKDQINLHNKSLLTDANNIDVDLKSIYHKNFFTKII